MVIDMGYIVNADKPYINGNIFEFEKRLESQYTIFLDKNPTFVTYYHISNINSTADNGFQDVESVLGKNSPVCFQRIDDFPIYGIENIKLDLSEEDQGLTSSYSGDGIILPHTIRPLPNDFFSITYLDKEILFVITSIDYDTIKSNNFYKIEFSIKYVEDNGWIDNFERQTIEIYDCIFQNIGTEDKCLIKHDEYQKIVHLEEAYSHLLDEYMTAFYSKRFNSLLFNDPDNNYMYDKYLTHFVTKNNLCNRKNTYQTYMMSNEDPNHRTHIEYYYTLYDAIERRDLTKLRYPRYFKTKILSPESIFSFYNATNVYSVMYIDTGNASIIPDDVIDNIRANSVPDNYGVFEKLLIDYFNDNISTIYTLPIDEIQEYHLQYELSDFIYIPIVLFILRFYGAKFMAT